MSFRKIYSKKSNEIFTFSDQWNTTEGHVKQLQLEISQCSPSPNHSHPTSSQSFKVIKGELKLRVNGKNLTLKTGQEYKINIGDEHSQWNENIEPTIIIESYNPPLDIEPFFTALPRALEHWNKFKFFVLLDDYKTIVSTNSSLNRRAIKRFSQIGRWLGYSDWYKK